MHYVIGDIHGCYDEFTIIRRKIEKMDPDAVIILTGDIIDRGPKVWEMLRWAMKNITANGKYQSILGNHEDMAMHWFAEWVRWYEDEDRQPEYEPKTDYDLLEVLKKHLDGLSDNKSSELTPELLRPIFDFFESLPLRKEVNLKVDKNKTIHFDIVHGADTFEKGISEAERRDINLWGRGGSDVDRNTIVVHGHTPTLILDYLTMDSEANRPGMIGYQKRDINLDGGCCFGPNTEDPCFLCAICLETMEEIYPRTLWGQIVRQSKRPKTRKEAMEEEDAYLTFYNVENNSHKKEILRMMKLDKES